MNLRFTIDDLRLTALRGSATIGSSVLLIYGSHPITTSASAQTDQTAGAAAPVIAIQDCGQGESSEIFSAPQVHPRNLQPSRHGQGDESDGRTGSQVHPGQENGVGPQVRQAVNRACAPAGGSQPSGWTFFRTAPRKHCSAAAMRCNRRLLPGSVLDLPVFADTTLFGAVSAPNNGGYHG